MRSGRFWPIYLSPVPRANRAAPVSLFLGQGHASREEVLLCTGTHLFLTGTHMCGWNLCLLHAHELTIRVLSLKPPLQTVCSGDLHGPPYS